MNIEDFRNYCLSLPGSQEKAPWKEPRYRNLITFSVSDKWFCILDLENKFCNLKCAPARVEELLNEYSGARQAWHMNKKHWVSIILDSDIPDREIRELVDGAYNLIVGSLPKSKRP